MNTTMTTNLASPESSSALAPSQAVLVRIDNVSKQFSNGTLAVHNVNLDLVAGQFISLLGPSGCGKSTLLRMIAGLGAPSGGRIDWPGSRSSRTEVNSASYSRSRR